jgi:hypothetical protein
MMTEFELVNVWQGHPRYEELIGQIRNDATLREQMWLDAEHRFEEVPGKVWSVAAVRDGDHWVPAAWAAARVEGGALLCSDNYERRDYRGRGLYAQAYAHRHRTVVLQICLPARTFIFAQPRGLHEADGWVLTGLSKTSHAAGIPHDWWELRREPLEDLSG